MHQKIHKISVKIAGQTKTYQIKISCRDSKPPPKSEYEYDRYVNEHKLKSF